MIAQKIGTEEFIVFSTFYSFEIRENESVKCAYVRFN